MSASRLHIAYYADDFTGATDALESLALAGLRTRLFLDPPTPARLAAHHGLHAVGVAGLTRSQATPDLARTLRPAFRALRRLRPRFVHYKVCSTFDSSPHIGSIGRAIEVGREVFGRRAVPLLVAAPTLGRYCIFGNLYARFGIGSQGAIHRLDRHPSVSRHPVTPMTEADLRRHLAKQTTLKTALFDLLEVQSHADDARARLRTVARDADIVLFDALRQEHVGRIGELLPTLAPASSPFFAVGSSGMGTALCAGKRPAPSGAGYDRGPARKRRDDSPLLVLSGSCSPVTAGQIACALADGFFGLRISCSPAREGRETSAILRALQTGKNVVAFTARGSARGRPIDPKILGSTLGRIARAVLAAIPLQRLVVAGGDTSSYAARALGIESVEFLSRFVPGAPLCRAAAPGSPADGLEVNFKGGQVGAPDFFVRISTANLR